MDLSDVDVKLWQERIADARTRRERFLPIWEMYARMHTNAYRAVRDKNDDALVIFPTGDQVKAGLIFRNIEQTLALLEVPEIGVRVTATDFARALGAEDTHRESVVEQALWRSMMRSGLIKEDEEVDYIKRDGTIIGHGINYTCWRIVEEEVEVPAIPVFEVDATGVFVPVLDDSGAPVFETVKQRRVVWEGCQDERISPLEFLCDPGARRLYKASWHGFERPVKLAELRKDPRYRIPDDVVGTSFAIRDIYGNEGQEEEVITDAVMVIVIWDKETKTLLTFLETSPPGGVVTRARQVGNSIKDRTRANQLITIGAMKWPVEFSHPDYSPFTFYIPIPAQDHPFGISQIEHARNQAVEADKLRTRQANITRQIKRIPWYKKGRVDPQQIEEAYRSPDVKPVGLDIQDGEKPEQLFGELPVPTVDPDIYKQYVIAEQGVDKTTGISDVPGGGADTATEAEHIFEIGNARARRKKRKYLSFLTAVACRHLDYLRQFSPEGETIIVPDVDGRPLTLAYGREAFEGDFQIEVVAGGGAMALSPVKQKLMVEAAGLLFGKFGPFFDRIFLRQLLTMFDFRDINELMRAAMLGMGAQVPPAMLVPPGAGARGSPPGGVPREQFSVDDYSTPQAIRAGINALNE